MKTRAALTALGGRSTSASPLADMADQLVMKARANEQQRMASARERANLQGVGPLLSVLQKRLAEASQQRLVNNAAPAITTGDMHQILKSASAAEEGKDRGLARAATHAYRLFTKDPTGSLSVGDVARLRTHYAAEYPRSKVASVIDSEVPRVGYNTLPVAHLSRIAAQIQRAGATQEAYEEAVETFGLAGEDAFRARAFIRAMIGVAEEPQPQRTAGLSERVQARLSTDDDPILSRFAQFMEPEEDDMFMDEAELDMDMDAPTDDKVESSETIESPITGEPLTLELEVEDDMVEFEDTEPAYDGPLPTDEGLEVLGQLDDFAEPMTDDVVEMDMDAPEEVVVMADPTDPEGGELEVTVRPLEDAGPMPATEPEPLPEDELGMSEDEDLMEMEATKHFSVYASVNGRLSREPIDVFKARGMSAALRRVASHGVRGHIHGNPSTMHRECFIQLDNGNFLRVRAEAKPELEGKDEAFQPDVNEQIPDDVAVPDADNIMVGDQSMGKQHHPHAALADAVLDGKVIKQAGWEMRVNGDADIELLYNGKRKRTASLADLDAVVSDFVRTAGKRQAKLRYQAFQHEDNGSFLVVTDVPKGEDKRDLTYNAKRMLKAIQKVVPAARGTLRKDAKLQVEFVGQPRQLAAVRKILEDRYRCAEYVIDRKAQMTDLPPSPGSAAQGGPIQLTPTDPALTPQNSASPAGTVVPPEQQQQQEQQSPGYVGPPAAETGQNAQADHGAMKAGFVVTYKDADGQTGETPVQARTASLAKQLFERFNDDCEVIKVAQLMDEPAMPPALDAMPGEPIDEPAPVDDMLMDAEPAGPDMGVAPDFGGGSALNPEEQEALKAALTHFRNQGVGPGTALDQLMTQYSDLFDRYGDKTDTQRHEVEAEAMKLVTEVWTQPGILEPKQAQQLNEEGDQFGTAVSVRAPEGLKNNPEALDKYMRSMQRIVMAVASKFNVNVDGDVQGREGYWELPGLDHNEARAIFDKFKADGIPFQVQQRLAQFEPPVNTQQPDYIAPPADDLGEDSETDDATTNAVEAPTVNTQVDPQGNFADTSDDLGADSETRDPGDFGAGKPDAHPDQHKQPGENFPSTEGPAAGLGDDSETDDKINKIFDDASKDGIDAFRSASNKSK